MILFGFILRLISSVLFVPLTNTLEDSNSKRFIRSEIIEESTADTIVHDILKSLTQYAKENVTYSNFKIIAHNQMIQNLFHIEEKSGLLKTRQQIDRDNLCKDRRLCCESGDVNKFFSGIELPTTMRKRTAEHCELTMRIIFEKSEQDFPDNSTLQRAGVDYVTVSVKIIDINDNTPRFIISRQKQYVDKSSNLVSVKNELLPVYELELEEHISEGNCFQLPEAVDEDSKINGISQFILEKLSEQEHFALSRYYQPHVEYRPISNWPFELSSKSCHSSYSQRYEYSNSEFELSQPFLKVVGTIDREVIEDYWMKLLAIDAEVPEKLLSKSISSNFSKSLRHTGSVLIHIRVRDINDHFPDVPSNLNLEVKEDAHLGQIVGTLKGTDKDNGENGNLHYSFDESALGYHILPFRIKADTGKIIVSQKLEADNGLNEKEFTFDIITSDSGKPTPKSAITHVTVRVINVNDETPEVKVVDLQSRNNPPLPSVMENKPPGELVAFVTASDADSGNYGVFQCRTDNSKFELIALTSPSTSNVEQLENSQILEHVATVVDYKLVTATVLDREASPTEHVKIICTDHASSENEIRTGSADFTVTILDENDNYPTFSAEKFELKIYENEPIEQIITVFNVTDSDQDLTFDNVNRFYHKSPRFPSDFNNKISQAMPITLTLDAIGQNYFRLGATGGALYTTKQLDREKTPQIEFNVTAIDAGDPPKSATASVIVTVLDKNDNAPRFQPELLQLEILENVSMNSFMFSAVATDDDVGINSMVTYFMEDSQQGLAERFFRVNSKNGSVHIRAPLDREKHEKFDFKIVATDHGVPRLSAQCRVQIRILDVNDNSPKFIYPNHPNHTIQASVHTSLNLPLVKLTATDEDEGLNAQLEFHLEGSSTEHEVFYLDKNTGELSLALTADVNSVIGLHELKFRVQDKGDPPHSAFTSLRIQLTGGELANDLSATNTKVHADLSNFAEAKTNKLRETFNQNIHRTQIAGSQKQYFEKGTTLTEADDQYFNQRFVYHLTPEKALIIVISLVTVSAIIALLLLIALGIIRRKQTNYLRAPAVEKRCAIQTKQIQIDGRLDNRLEGHHSHIYPTINTVDQKEMTRNGRIYSPKSLYNTMQTASRKERLFGNPEGLKHDFLLMDEYSNKPENELKCKTIDRTALCSFKLKPESNFPVELPSPQYRTYSCRDAPRDESQDGTRESRNIYTKLGQHSTTDGAAYQVIDEVRGKRSHADTNDLQFASKSTHSIIRDVRFDESAANFIPEFHCDCSMAGHDEQNEATSVATVSEMEPDKSLISSPCFCKKDVSMYL